MNSPQDENLLEEDKADDDDEPQIELEEESVQREEGEEPVEVIENREEISENEEIVEENDEADEDVEEEAEKTVREEVIGQKRKRELRPNLVSKRPNRCSKNIYFPKNTKEKISLKRDEVIEYDDGNEVIKAVILGREKVSGNYYNYFNVQGEDGLNRNVNLERVKFRKIDEIEQCFMVIVPHEHHGTPEVLKAKLDELQKLKDFKSYVIVDDIGQYRISSTWVIYYKGDEVRGRLVARGFEEQEDVPSDSPTVEKCNLRLVLVFSASYGWIIESSDVKSAFLQGKHLERDVVVVAPKEANLPKGKLWKLTVPLYGLSDASLQFF